MWQFFTAQPVLLGVLYTLTLISVVFLIAGIAHEKTKRDLAWANAETTESEAKVQVAAMDLEKVKTLASAHEQYHQAHDVGQAHVGIYPNPN